MTAAYVGSRGRNLFLRSVTNLILPGSATVSDPAANFPTGVGIINVVRADGTVTPSTVRQFDIVSGRTISKPFAEVDFKTSGGFNTYNAFQLSFQRRYSAGLTLNGQYTYSKNFGNSAGSNEALTANNPFDFNNDIGYNSFDVRHLMNVSALYALPFGKGKQYMGDVTGATQALLGNWEVGAILNGRSGFPVDLRITRNDIVCQNTTTGVVTNTGTVNGFANSCAAGSVGVINTPGGGATRNVRRPDIVAGVDPFTNVNGLLFINPAAFATPKPGTFGNAERGFLHGPDFTQFDLSFIKRFPIRESLNFEFRTEIFNLFNGVNFANPVGTLPNALGTASNQVQPGQPFSTAASGSFGKLTSTIGRTVAQGTARQIQFALRINF